MAEQTGIIPLEGTIGNITFYQTKDGFRARRKGGIKASRIASDAAFQRTRENGAEFGRACVAGKVLRNALRSLLMNTADGRMIARLTKVMMKVIQADKLNPRGLRNVIDGKAGLLEGFEFNINSPLGTSLVAEYSASVDRTSGSLSVNIPSFVPLTMVAAPLGATHFKIISAGVEIDFEKEVNVVKLSSTAALPWDTNATGEIDLVNNVTVNSAHPLFLVLGIEFYQEVNNIMCPLKSGAFNSLKLVKVNGE